MLPLFLAACYPPASYQTSSAGKARAEALATTQPQEVKRRWGSLAETVDKCWVGENDGNTHLVRPKWIVSGSVMDYNHLAFVNGECHSFQRLAQYNPEKDRIDFYIPNLQSAPRHGKVQADGSMLTSSSIGFGETLRCDPSRGLFTVGTMEMKPVSTGEEDRLLAEFRQQRDAARQESYERSRAFNQGLANFTNTLSTELASTPAQAVVPSPATGAPAAAPQATLQVSPAPGFGEIPEFVPHKEIAHPYYVMATRIDQGGAETPGRRLYFSQIMKTNVPEWNAANKDAIRNQFSSAVSRRYGGDGAVIFQTHTTRERVQLAMREIQQAHANKEAVQTSIPLQLN